MEKLSNFVDFNLKRGNVPRVSDVIEYAKKKGIEFKRSNIVDLMRLHPIYIDNLHQEREKKRSRKQRPIISNVLGNLHADLGYYSVVREYKTPKTFQYGFFVAKDVLSRFVYVELMMGPKSASNMIRVLKRLLLKHEKIHNYKIQSIGFDKEPAMMSHQVQNFLKSMGIKFVYFEFSATKAKVAENAIKLIRTDVQRLINKDKRQRWWNLLQKVADNLNKKEIILNGKRTGYRPIDLTLDNVKDFVKRVQKIMPGYYFTQFNLPPQLFKFKFEIGNFVRPKIIATNSQAIGKKTSQVNLVSDKFKILLQVPFVTSDLNIRKSYKCINTRTDEIEIFSEEDLALST